jgi:hypothetical protein
MNQTVPLPRFCVLHEGVSEIRKVAENYRRINLAYTAGVEVLTI